MIKHGEAKEEESGEVSTEKFVSLKEMPVGWERAERAVLLNPDDYESWNVLKEQVLECTRKGYKDIERTEEVEIIITKQLLLTQNAIKLNPKSYSSWFHRAFLFDELRRSSSRSNGNNMPKGDDEEQKKFTKNDFSLCKLLLFYDSRNFHCWNYMLRRGFTIKPSLDNYSSLHHYLRLKNEKGGTKEIVEWLFIDPLDESLWRCFDTALCQQRNATLRVYSSKIELVEYLNGKIKFSVLKFDNKEACIEEDKHGDIKIATKGNFMTFRRHEDHPVIEKILGLTPKNMHALRRKSNKTREEWELLKKIDPLRRKYYSMLEDELFVEYYSDQRI